MNFWTYENLRQVMGGRWLVRPAVEGMEQPLPGVTTDSREVRAGSVFFARKGEATDGHRFLRQAAEAGAALLVVDDEEAFNAEPKPRVPVLRVEDSTASLGRLAAAYRNALRAKVIAVTGSVGKTTTKALIHSILSVKLRGSASPKSFNNEVGVPMTILAADPVDQYLVVEVGTNAPGEIAALGRIVQPDIAVITHIGSAHLEGLGGPEGVLREKASLLSHLREGGLAVVNGDCKGLPDYRKVVPTMVTFGRSESCDLRLTDFRGSEEGVAFEVNDRFQFRLPLLGEHNAMNALAAIAVGRHMNLTEEQMVEGLARAAPPQMRLKVERFGPPQSPLVVINDCYNANPDSVAAALKVLRQYPTAGRRIAVLGDMAELGNGGPDLHRALGEAVVESRIDKAYFVGRLSMFTAESVCRHWPAERVHAFPAWSEGLPREVAAELEPGDTVLVKASRVMGFERLLPAIAERFDGVGNKLP